MKTIVRALTWSLGLELLLVAPVLLANHVCLGPLEVVFGILAYLALFCHAPAMYLLGHWPSARETLIAPVMVQWFIWLMAFATIFTLAGWFHRRITPHEAGGS